MKQTEMYFVYKMKDKGEDEFVDVVSIDNVEKWEKENPKHFLIHSDDMSEEMLDRIENSPY